MNEYSSENWLVFLQKEKQVLQQLTKIDVFKGSGKGGQKKNKTSNTIRITFNHLVVTEGASRSKQENLEKAIKKLRLSIAMDYQVESNRGNQEPQCPIGVELYVQGGPLRINPNNPQYPFFIGYLLDVLLFFQFSWKESANHFNTSPSQLRKFVGKDPWLLQRLQQIEHLYQSQNRDKE
ncbi:MAG: hypothetical protein ACI86H_000804 [bacterium]|jgi:hypothetical protein